jgi:Gram-negative bacterial TonB protein C-terminal
MRTMILVGLIFVWASAARAQNTLEAAKDLYASAAYEEALTTLSRVGESVAGTPAVLRQVDEYRAFCLYALGRTAEAESVAEGLIRRDPLVRLDAADASPRLEAMFAKVQKRILPGLIRDEYRNLRPMLDQKQFAAAEPRLAETRRMLSEAERVGAVDEGLADLAVIIDGFLALSRAQIDMPSPRPRAASASAPDSASASAVLEAASGPLEAAAPTPNIPRGPRVYSVKDADVTPPVTIYQREPSIPVELATILRTVKRPTVLSLTIDEDGRVQKTEVHLSVNKSYDTLLTRAASTWKYRPATKGGRPVSYEKIVVIEFK